MSSTFSIESMSLFFLLNHIFEYSWSSFCGFPFFRILFPFCLARPFCIFSFLRFFFDETVLFCSDFCRGKKDCILYWGTPKAALSLYHIWIKRESNQFFFKEIQSRKVVSHYYFFFVQVLPVIEEVIFFFAKSFRDVEISTMDKIGGVSNKLLELLLLNFRVNKNRLWTHGCNAFNSHIIRETSVSR